MIEVDLDYRADYWEDERAKAGFKKFLVDIHGLDLSRWEECGYWDRDYRPFSFFDAEGVVSSVCAYSMDLIVEGRPCRAVQISGVGTRPGLRRRGLNRELTRRALDWARDTHEFCFLFADDDAVPFYAKCGFRPVDEQATCIPLTPAHDTRTPVKLDMEREADRRLVYDRASDRTPVSDRLGVLNEKLLMFWCLYALHDCVYHIPDLDVVTLFRRTDAKVTVFDVIGKSVPDFATLYDHIGAPGDSLAELLFMADKLDIGNGTPTRIEGNNTHVRGAFPLEGSAFVFPYTSHA